MMHNHKDTHTYNTQDTEQSRECRSKQENILWLITEERKGHLTVHGRGDYSHSFDCLGALILNLFSVLIAFSWNVKNVSITCFKSWTILINLNIDKVSGMQFTQVILQAHHLLFLFLRRFTVVESFKTSLMAMMSTGATGCVMSTRPTLWLNKTWWHARTAGKSTSTLSGQCSPTRSCWCGIARSLPRGSAASRLTSNQVSAANTWINTFIVKIFLFAICSCNTVAIRQIWKQSRTLLSYIGFK